MSKIKRVYTRVYTDNRSLRAYVEWADGGRTEGRAVYYHGVLIPKSEHMGAIFDAALAAGHTIEREIW